jgi:hypothetical protein
MPANEDLSSQWFVYGSSIKPAGGFPQILARLYSFLRGNHGTKALVRAT